MARISAPDWEGISEELADENVKLRAQIAEGDKEFVKLEQEVVRLREALEYMSYNGCTMNEPCLEGVDREWKCFACIARAALRDV